MTTAQVSHEHAEVVVQTFPPVRVAHVHAEVVIRTHPPARVSHVHAEVVVRTNVTKQWWTPEGTAVQVMGALKI